MPLRDVGFIMGLAAAAVIALAAPAGAVHCPSPEKLGIVKLGATEVTYSWEPWSTHYVGKHCSCLKKGLQVRNLCEYGTSPPSECTRLFNNNRHVYTGMDPYTTYTLCIQGLCNYGYSAPSCVTFKTAVAAPWCPSEVFVDISGSTSLDVSWRLPLRLNGPLDGYRVSWCKRSRCSSSSDEARVLSTRRDYVITGLEPYVKYTVRVESYNIKDGKFLYCGANYVHATTEATYPDQPSMTVWKKDATSVMYRIGRPQQPNGPINGYELRTCPVLRCYGFLNVTWQIPQSNPGVDTITGMMAWQDYNFTLRAYNLVGNRRLYSPEFSVTVNTMAFTMSKPRQLVAAAVSSDTVELTWSSPSSADIDPKYYRISWCTMEGKNCLYKHVQDKRDTKIGLLKPWTSHRFEVLAVSRFGDYFSFGNPSSINVTTLPGVSSPPVNIRILEGSAVMLSLAWDKPLDPQGPIDGYIIDMCRKDDASCSNIATLRGSLKNITVSNLRPYTEYRFQIMAFHDLPEGKTIVGGPGMLNVTTEAM